MHTNFDHQRTATASLTEHAACRSQQRAIPPAVIDLLIEFGDAAKAFGGAERYSFSKRGWRAAAAYLGPGARHYERYRSTYVVMAGRLIITAGWIH